MQPENLNNEHKQTFSPEPHKDVVSQTGLTPNNPFASQQATETPAPTAPMPDPIEVSSFQTSPPHESVVETEQPKYAMQTAPAAVAVETPKANVSDLTLYLVVLFSGLSVIASASYLAWTVLTHFLTEPQGFSLFDFSTFNIYILIYLVLFGTLNILASLRLDKRVREQGVVGGSLSTVGAIWRALLVVWGVSAVVGILYSPLSASIAGDEATGSKIAIDVVSALFALALIAGFFWRDVLLHKVRTALIPTIVITVLVVLVSSVGAYTTLNPKKATPETTTPIDYSSSFESYDSDSSSSEANSDSSTQEFDFSETE